MSFYQEKELQAPVGLIGIDFSGAASNGDTLWVTQGVIYEGQCHIRSCEPAREKFGLTKRQDVLIALRNWLAAQPPSLVGVDVPFGLPSAFIAAKNWEGFLSNFTRQFDSADQFKEACDDVATSFNEGKASKKEIKRLTDIEAQAPFSPYNLQMYRQTFYWLRDVLYPLVSEQMVCVLPMMPPQSKRSWLYEVCPASYLKHNNLYQPYKGKEENQLQQRRNILNALKRKKNFILKDRSLTKKIIENTGGDGLDSVIACWLAFENQDTVLSINPDAGKPKQYFLEGCVFY